MATLYHPDGRRYETDSKVETTRLKARGYTDKAPAKADSSKQDPKKS